MQGKILDALCEAQFPNLIESAKHHHLAHFHANRYFRKMKIVGPLYNKQIKAHKGYVDICRKIEISKRVLINGEIRGIF